MPQVNEFEVFLLVDAAGDYAVGVSIDAAKEQYANEVQPIDDAEGFRIIAAKIKVPLPQIVELTGEVSADHAAEMTLIVKEPK